MSIDSETGMTCLRCGGENNPRRSFCRSCGLPFPTTDVSASKPVSAVCERAPRRPPTRPAPLPKVAPLRLPGYSGREVMRLTGVSYRQLDYWDRTSLLSPSVVAANGSGSQRRYDDHDVRVLGLIKQLLDAGVSLQRIRECDLHALPRHECVLLIGDAIAIVSSAEDLLAGLRGPGVVTVVRVPAVEGVAVSA